MTTTINASTSSGLVNTADTSGIIKLQSNGVTTNALAWVNFNGTAGTLTNSYNFSSMTKGGTGDYTLNFTNAMSNANYALLCTSGRAPWTLNGNDVSTPNSTSSFRVRLADGSGTNQDYTNLWCVVFGN